jgi:hypothetical protein
VFVWVDRRPELDSVTPASDVVLICEVVVITADGRADFELLGTLIRGRRHNPNPDAVGPAEGIAARVVGLAPLLEHVAR